MSDPMPPALSEAVGALRVLGDPASAWGPARDEGMRMFSKAARERVVQMYEVEIAQRELCNSCGNYPATFTGRCRRCNASLQEERDAA